MSVKLLTEHHSLNEATQARLSLHVSKCHIVGNLMSRLINKMFQITHMTLESKVKVKYIKICVMARDANSSGLALSLAIVAICY